ncbi:MAG: hypothetical protein QE285_17260 [Aquabacterium sp.]|nr:hypothetical protein [Aquabacterium sp.]
MDVARDPCDVFRLRCAFSEAMFVLIVCGMWATPQDSDDTPACWPVIKSGLQP